MGVHIREVLKMFRNKNNKIFLLSSHQNLEGDALGSQLALAQLLKSLKKKVIMYAPDEVPAAYSFLPDTGRVKTGADAKETDYDVACILDCTGLDRLGDMKRVIDFKRPIINIDHHISNTYFGTVNWVEPGFSCTGEQIYRLFKEMDIPINKKAALSMYVAILTDTGSFRYSNTTARSHEAAAELIRKGLKPTDIYRKIYEVAHRSHLALLSRVLSTLEMTKDGSVAWTSVTEGMMKAHKANAEVAQDFVNFPRSIKGVKIAMGFREEGKGSVKVSFRSNEGIDVCRLAKQCGGGGHHSASGCTMKGSLDEVKEAVLIKTAKYLKGLERK